MTSEAWQKQTKIILQEKVAMRMGKSWIEGQKEKVLKERALKKEEKESNALKRNLCEAG